MCDTILGSDTVRSLSVLFFVQALEPRCDYAFRRPKEAPWATESLRSFGQSVVWVVVLLDPAIQIVGLAAIESSSTLTL